MPFRPRTDVRVTVHFIQNAKLVFCRQSHRFAAQSFFPQDFNGILRHSAGDCPGSKIEDFFRLALTAGSERREHDGHRLSHTGRSLDEQLFFSQDRPVHAADDLPLPLSVREGKFQPLHRSISGISPLPGKFNPGMVFLDQIQEPAFQLRPSIFPFQTDDVFRLQIGIGHTYTDGFQLFITSIHIGITFSLRQMHRYGLCQLCHIPVHAFDLVDSYMAIRIRDDTVCPPFKFNAVFRIFLYIHQRYLALVATFLGFLDFPVETAALLHRLPVRSTALTIVQITAS